MWNRAWSIFCGSKWKYSSWFPYMILLCSTKHWQIDLSENEVSIITVNRAWGTNRIGGIFFSPSNLYLGWTRFKVSRLLTCLQAQPSWFGRCRPELLLWMRRARALFSLIPYQNLLSPREAAEEGCWLTSSHLISMSSTDGCEHSLAPRSPGSTGKWSLMGSYRGGGVGSWKRGNKNLCKCPSPLSLLERNMKNLH